MIYNIWLLVAVDTRSSLKCGYQQHNMTKKNITNPNGASNATHNTNCSMRPHLTPPHDAAILTNQNIYTQTTLTYLDSVAGAHAVDDIVKGEQSHRVRRLTCIIVYSV